MVKSLVWIGPSLKDVRSFPSRARAEIAYQLYKVQQGLEPTDWKPMSIVGPGVRELRVHTGNEYRVLYLVTVRETVYVLHAFMKETAKTAKTDIELAKRRLASLRRGRSGS